MPRRVSKPKRWTEFDVLRALVILAIVIYILGIVPQFTDGIRSLFTNPLMKVVFLALIVFAGYLDSTIGTLLAVAFLISYLSTPEYKGSPVYDVLSDVQSGAGQVVGGVGSGASRLIGGVGSGAQELVGGVAGGAQELVGGVGSGAQQLVGGLQRGASRLVGGVGGGAQHLLGGAQRLVGGVEGGVQQVLGGVGSGAQKLVGGAQAGTQQLLGGAQSGTQQLIGGVSGGAQHLATGLSSGAQQLLGGAENLENPPMSVSQAYQQQMDGGAGCNVQPSMATGCDPIVGYNAPYGPGGPDAACLNEGVQVWKDEMNAQGLNHPRGYAGGQVGSTY